MRASDGHLCAAPIVSRALDGNVARVGPLCVVRNIHAHLRSANSHCTGAMLEDEDLVGLIIRVPDDQVIVAVAVNVRSISSEGR